MRTVLLADPCYVCGARSEAIDHVVPTATGGDDHWTNFAGICKSCNSRKGSKPLLMFLANERGIRMVKEQPRHRRPRLDDGTTAAINQIRGVIPFDRWVNKALEHAVETGFDPQNTPPAPKK